MPIQPRSIRPSDKSSLPRKHQCGFCEKRFFTMSDCRRHERIHTGEKPFKCDVCGRTFNQKSNMENHRMQQHFQQLFGKDPYTIWLLYMSQVVVIAWIKCLIWKNNIVEADNWQKNTDFIEILNFMFLCGSSTRSYWNFMLKDEDDIDCVLAWETRGDLI